MTRVKAGRIYKQWDVSKTGDGLPSCPLLIISIFFREKTSEVIQIECEEERVLDLQI